MESVKKLNDLDFFYPNSLPNLIPSMLFPPNTTYEETSSVGPDGKMVPFDRPITSLNPWSATEKSNRQTKFLVKYLGISNFSKLLQTFAMYPVVKDIVQAFVTLLLKDGVTHFEVQIDKPPEFFEQRGSPLVPISLYYVADYLLTGAVSQLQEKPKLAITHTNHKIKEFYIFTYDALLAYIKNRLSIMGMDPIPIVDAQFVEFISNPIIIIFKIFIFPVLNKLCELNQYEETHEDVKNIDFIDLLTRKQPTPSEYQEMEQAPVEELSPPPLELPVADAVGLGQLESPTDTSHDSWLSGWFSGAEAPLGAAEAPLGAAEAPLGAAEGAEEAVAKGLSDGLTYFHKKYPKLNSSITLYGENHSENYKNFLNAYIEHLYKSKRTNILIIEISSWELQSDKDKFKDELSSILKASAISPVKLLSNDNMAAKILAVRFFHRPIMYFNALLISDGGIPNTQILCGDCRFTEFVYMYEEIDNLMTKVTEGVYSEDAPVDKIFLAKFMSMWEKQLSIFRPLLDRKRTSIETSIFERYKKGVEEITEALKDIKTIHDLHFYSELVLKMQWASLSNLHMLLTIIRNMKRDVDITLFVGKGHMEDLTQSIQEFKFESYFESQELEKREIQRRKETKEGLRLSSAPLSLVSKTRMKFGNIENPHGSPLDFGGKRTRKHKQKRSTNKKCRIHKKRSTNKKCRIHKKRRRMSKRHI